MRIANQPPGHRQHIGHGRYEPSPVSVPAADHVLPDQHAKTVTVIIPPLRFDLDMFPEHVEAKGLHPENIIHQGLIGRSRIQAVRIIPLVKDTVLIIWPVVQEQA